MRLPEPAAARVSAAASALCLALLAVAGCVFKGDPAYSFGVRNDSDQAVIVRFSASGYLAPPGGAGMAAQGIGALEGTIVVLDLSCRVLQSSPITTQLGNVEIAPNGVARLIPSDASFTDQLERTEDCHP